MTEGYNPTENAIAERVNGIIKQEWLYHMKRPKNLDDARCIIAGIIDFYNNKRPHMSNGMLTPRQMREKHCASSKTKCNKGEEKETTSITNKKRRPKSPKD